MAYLSKIVSYILPGLGTAIILTTMIILGKSPKQKRQAKNLITHTAPRIVPEKKVHIIFDLHGVLFKINKKKTLGQLGFLDMLSYTVTGNNPHDLEDIMFDLLHKLNGDDPATYGYGDKLVPMHNNRPLPHLMCEWMRGTIPGEKIIKDLTAYVEKLGKEKYFKTSVERKLIKKVIAIMFNPAVRYKLYQPINKGVALLHDCKKAGHTVYLLSNMDAELVDLLQVDYPDVFNAFDGIIISADINMLKPDTSIYHYAVDAFDIDPKITYFLDDQPENIAGAQKAKLNSIQFTHKLAKQVRKTFAELNILPDQTYGDDGHEDIDEDVEAA